MYVRATFVFDRIKALAPQHPQWQTTDPFASVLKGDLKAVAAGGHHALLELAIATHADMTTEEFDAIATDCDYHRTTPEDRSALHRNGLPADVGIARLFAGQRIQDLHRFRRRHRLHEGEQRDSAFR